jgi:hypothetical protein
MAIITSSSLDFDTIKQALKTKLQASSEFADYDFEGAGLSNILDVLAYNTHLNGLVANIAINETFLNSAQLRSSVVSHAETIGYYPHSKTASLATISASVATSDTVTAQATLPANTTFTGTIGDTSYTFQTLEAFTAANDGAGNFAFLNSSGTASLSIKEGTLKTKTFIVGDSTEEQVYIIPDTELDKNTMKVDVFDTTTSSSFTSYSNVENTVRIESTSTIFVVRETPNGFFELIFGEGNVLGKSPSAGNKIVVTYLASNAAAANGISTFTADDDIRINGSDYTLNVTTLTASAAGDDKESITSIKRNAPLVFASQQRLVTADDYKAIIGQRFNSLISDVISWGGEDNVPAIYGRTYVSINFFENIPEDIQTATKNTIATTISENLAVMSIDTVFADPAFTFIELRVKFDFDPELTNVTLDTTQNNIKSAVASYFTENLGMFNKSFRQSGLITSIDALSPAILNSSMTVKAQRRFNPTLNTVGNYTIDFPMAIAAPDDVNFVLTSSSVTYDGKTSVLRNRLSSTTIEVFDTINGVVVEDNVGSYNRNTGVITFTGFGSKLSAYVGDAIKISVTPANQQTIKPLRNYILDIDLSLTTASGTIDNDNTTTSLTV